MNSSRIVEIFDRAPAIFWTADRELTLTSISALGSGSLQLPVVTLEELLPALVFGEAPVIAHRRALNGDSARFELRLHGHHWLGLVEPTRGAAGTVEGVNAAVFDHTDRSFTEKSLRLSEESYRSMIEEAPFAIARVTSSGHLLQVNRAMVEILAYESEQELLIQHLGSDVFVSPQAYEEFVAEVSEGRSVQGMESVWRRRDGKTIAVSLAGRANRDELGKLSHVEILAENITERKHLEHQLRQAQKLQAVGQLAGGIAHDFNNLLTVINGQVHMALMELLPADPLRERLVDVEAAAGRATNLTRQLLAFGRFQAIEAKVLNLNSVVLGLTQMLDRLIGKSIELKFLPRVDLEHVKADAAQLEQVIMNLVLNAKDATPEGGRLTILTDNAVVDSSSPGHPENSPAGVPDGKYVVLIVQDTGQGMSPETQARIFEPFFTTKKAGEGTGLGLAMVYTIVKQHKGFIETESELGVGTRFTIYLPAVAAPIRHDSPSVAVPAKGGRETILLAEDEEMIRKFFSSFLTRLGYRVLCAADGVDALVLAHREAGKIDLLITDIMMPRMGGRELAEETRRIWPGVKILFITGYSADPSLKDVLKSLNARLIQKPFPSMPAFANSIREVLDLRVNGPA